MVAKGNAHTSFSHLTQEEAQHFLEHGWVRIPNAIDPKYLSWLDDLWVRTGMDPNDKSTWTEEYFKLPRHREVRTEEFCPTAWRKIVDIVGGEDKIDPVRERWYGDQFIVNFGTEAWKTKQHTTEDLRGWHTDNDWYRQFLDSSGNALTLIFCFTDILPDGGGTAVAEDGIAGICKKLYDVPEGIDPPLEHLYTHIGDCDTVRTIVANRGDLIITHALLPHTYSPNHKHYARVITNPRVNLVEPYNLNRADGDYTLCEQVILRAMNRESIPEYKPTRDRLSYYPRTAFFKRERVKAELERMIAAAEASGGSSADVDSVYLRGEAAVKEHEQRNGYDKAFGPNGVLSRYDKDGLATVKPGGTRHVVY